MDISFLRRDMNKRRNNLFALYSYITTWTTILNFWIRFHGILDCWLTDWRWWLGEDIRQVGQRLLCCCTGTKSLIRVGGCQEFHWWPKLLWGTHFLAQGNTPMTCGESQDKSGEITNGYYLCLILTFPEHGMVINAKMVNVIARSYCSLSDHARWDKQASKQATFCL